MTFFFLFLATYDIGVFKFLHNKRKELCHKENYPAEKLVKKISKAETLPINGIIGVCILFKIIWAKAATRSTHAYTIVLQKLIESKKKEVKAFK